MLMTMLRAFFLFCTIHTLVPATAQWQIGLAGGTSHYVGDLTEKLFIGPLTRAAFGLQIRYGIGQHLVLRGGGMLARVAGHDRYQSRLNLRARNLSFESNLAEASGVLELHGFGVDKKRWSPYVFGGLALFYFNPYTFDATGSQVFLRPLRTEGQGFPGYPVQELYPTVQWALPFGGGVRYNLTDKWLVHFEFGLRKLFTDYLDDVSTTYADPADLLQYAGPRAVALAYRADELPGGNEVPPAKGDQRGGAARKDYYYFTTIGLSLRLGEGGAFGSDSRRSGYGCPVNF